MKRLHWLLVGLAVLLLGTGGVATWAYTHRAYPDVVYYRLSTVYLAGGQSFIDEWIDPQRQLVRRQQRWLGEQQGWTLVTNGRLYGIWDDGSSRGVPLWPTVAHGIADLNQGLRVDGFTGVGMRLLATRTGKAVRKTLDGHSALCFATTYGDANQTHGVLCIDARTYVPLSLASLTPSGLPQENQYTDNRRLAPYTLPADFFDPPHKPASLWDQATGWVHDHFGLSR